MPSRYWQHCRTAPTSARGLLLRTGGTLPPPRATQTAAGGGCGDDCAGDQSCESVDRSACLHWRHLQSATSKHWHSCDTGPSIHAQHLLRASRPVCLSFAHLCVYPTINRQYVGPPQPEHQHHFHRPPLIPRLAARLPMMASSSMCPICLQGIDRLFAPGQITQGQGLVAGEHGTTAQRWTSSSAPAWPQ